VLGHIRRQELLRAGDRLGVAVSGGIDSVALLRLLLELRGELGIVLSVVHFNHKLRGAESDADQEFVAGLALEHDLEFHCDGDDVGRHATEERVSIETAARELRYGFFRHLLGAGSRSGTETLVHNEVKTRSAGSAAPPKGGTQGLKPASAGEPQRGPEGPLFHGINHGVNHAVNHAAHDDAPESRTPSDPDSILSNSVSRCSNKIATGHTLDDQAETVLMRLIRGAGLRGLGGIYPRILVEGEDGEVCGEIVRPLLAARRRELEQYLKDIGQSWREDSTNADTSLTRNRVRKVVVPLLEKEFNPAIAESLSELAEIARSEEDYWENEVAGWMGTAVHWSEPEWMRVGSDVDGLVQIAGLGNVSAGSASVNTPTSRAKSAREMGHPGREMGHQGIDDLAGDDLQTRIDNAPWLVANATVDLLWFLGELPAVQRRLVKAVGEQAGIPLEFKHVEEILRFAAEHGEGKERSLPLGWKVVREPDRLVFVTPDLREHALAHDYEHDLPIPGQLFIPETGTIIEVRCVASGDGAAYNSEQVLDAESLPGPLRVRNWRAGDRYWPAHTKSPKKIKELLQARHVAQPERGLWPVVVSRDESGEEIVWMRGFPVPAKLRAKPKRAAIVILENTIAESSLGESLPK
jgi:tRNA(Ile)-lysidine synthetase-like protein